MFKKNFNFMILRLSTHKDIKALCLFSSLCSSVMIFVVIGNEFLSFLFLSNFKLTRNCNAITERPAVPITLLFPTVISKITIVLYQNKKTDISIRQLTIL